MADRPSERKLDYRAPVVLAFGAVAAAGLTGLLVPGAALFSSLSLHVGTGTAVSVVGLVAAYLLLARFASTQSVADLLLVAALVVLVLTNLCFATIPELTGALGSKFSTWASAAGRVSGASLLAAAALWPRRRVRSKLVVRGVFGACGGLLLGLGLVAGLLNEALPPGVIELEGPASRGEGVRTAPALSVIHIVTSVALGVASAGFLRRAMSAEDQLLVWFGAAAGLLSLAFLYYSIFPSLYSEWASAGDLLRVAASVLLLVGTLGEISLYRRQATRAGRLAERERLARDLHDGVAQDLAFVLGRLRDLERAGLENGDARRLAELVTVARHAYESSRQSISGLGLPVDLPLGAAIDQTARSVSFSRDTTVAVHADQAVELPRRVKEALLRIVREAVANAVRHGRARTVRVTLMSGDGLLLDVEDDGLGFAAAPSPGLGLKLIYARAEEHGGRATMTSTPGKGTVLRVHLPRALMQRPEGRRPEGRRRFAHRRRAESPPFRA